MSSNAKYKPQTLPLTAWVFATEKNNQKDGGSPVLGAEAGCLAVGRALTKQAFRLSLAADTGWLQRAGGQTITRALPCSGQPWGDLCGSFLGRSRRGDAAEQPVFVFAGLDKLLQQQHFAKQSLFNLC